MSGHKHAPDSDTAARWSERRARRAAARLGTVLISLVGLLSAGCAGGGNGDADVNAALLSATVPPQHVEGERLFEINCASCHGPRATGTSVGPPLAHIVYEPSHHADAAFFLAVERGVRAHHWRFGDMPPVPGLSREEIAEIVEYVRWLQRHVGIE